MISLGTNDLVKDAPALLALVEAWIKAHAPAVPTAASLSLPANANVVPLIAKTGT